MPAPGPGIAPLDMGSRVVEPLTLHQLGTSKNLSQIPT
jgi:hypothetical protein